MKFEFFMAMVLPTVTHQEKQVRVAGGKPVFYEPPELKDRYTIVIVTHNMQQAARISDKTAFLLLGEIIEYNDTTELFTRPQNKKTEEYITGRFG